MNGAKVLRLVAEAAVREVAGTSASPVQIERIVGEALREASAVAGGSVFPLYVPVVTTAERVERVRMARVLIAQGMTSEVVAQRIGMSERSVRRIRRQSL